MYVKLIMGVVDLGQASARARAHCRSQLFFDVHARRCKILLLLIMSLYRFFTKAGMPSRVPSLTDKKFENANTSIRTCGLSARAWAWLYSHVSRPPNLNPPIFLFTLVGANPPNLMPAKFSGYTVIKYVSLLLQAMIAILSTSMGINSKEATYLYKKSVTK